MRDEWRRGRGGDGGDWRGRKEGNRQRSWVPGELGVRVRGGEHNSGGGRRPLKRQKQLCAGVGAWVSVWI